MVGARPVGEERYGFVPGWSVVGSGSVSPGAFADQLAYSVSLTYPSPSLSANDRGYTW